MFSLGKRGRELVKFHIDFLEFCGIVRLCQEMEDEATFGTMRLAHSILETALHEL